MKEFKIVDELNLEAKKSLGILKEFKEFALRGNVVDLAVGVVIGAAFSKVVTSIVSDFIAPLIGILTGGGADLKNKFISLEPGKTLGINTLADAQKIAPVIAYGQFIATVIDFVIVAFFIFLVVKFTNRFKNTEPLPPAPPTNQEKLLTEIRDILKARA